MWLPVAGVARPATEHMEQFAAGITTEDRLIVPDLADQLRALMQPGMDHMNDTTQVFIALVKNGIADVGVQQVSGTGVVGASTRFIHSCEPLMPPSILPFYNSRPYAALLHDPTVASPTEVVRRARWIAQRCIAHERVLNGGHNTAIGGAVDVVLVTAADARLVP
jgi:hypothetical protein